MMHASVRDFIVGLFVLVGIVAVGYLSISIGGSSWTSRSGLKLYADFTETGDLVVRAPVVIGGVRVGEVTSITLEKDFRARVDIDVDPSLKLSTDTSASIVTAGLLGDRYIQLQPGGEEQDLKSGDKINYTEPAMIMERLIGQFIYGSAKGSDGKASPGPTTKSGGL